MNEYLRIHVFGLIPDHCHFVQTVLNLARLVLVHHQKWGGVWHCRTNFSIPGTGTSGGNWEQLVRRFEGGQAFALAVGQHPAPSHPGLMSIKWKDQVFRGSLSHYPYITLKEGRSWPSVRTDREWSWYLFTKLESTVLTVFPGLESNLALPILAAFVRITVSEILQTFLEHFNRLNVPLHTMLNAFWENDSRICAFPKW